MNMSEYYGPTVKAAKMASTLIGITTSGKEQDWEIEFADPEIIPRLLNALELRKFDDEAKTALYLLLLASLELEFSSGKKNQLHIVKTKEIIDGDKKSLEKMQFYWIHLKKSEHQSLMKDILHIQNFNSSI